VDMVCVSLSKHTNQGPQPSAPMLHGVRLCAVMVTSVEKLNGIDRSSSHSSDINHIRRKGGCVGFAYCKLFKCRSSCPQLVSGGTRDKCRAPLTKAASSELEVLFFLDEILPIALKRLSMQ